MVWAERNFRTAKREQAGSDSQCCLKRQTWVMVASNELSRIISIMESSKPSEYLIGHDAPVSHRDLDDYHRWPVASSISNIIDASPGDWSTRIALYGNWGDGKTSVLNFLEQQQRKKGNIVVRFSSWGAKDEVDIWKAFAGALRTKLKAEGIVLPGRLKALFKNHASTAQTIVRAGGSLVDKSIAFPVASPVIDVGLGWIQKFLGFSKADLECILKSVGSKRLVIFVDDLDRTAPTLLPRLLLILRELLDLPKFVFVLAFDKSMVSRALAEYNKAWGDSGELFLEKIVDFTIELPEPKNEDVLRLANRFFGQFNDFFPVDVLTALVELLPKNPRTLKLLARTIASFGAEARRHEPGELDWQAITIFNLLRMENEAFAAEFVKRIFDDDDFSWMRWAMSADADKEQDEKFNELIAKFFGADAAKQVRVRALVKFLREKAPFYIPERTLYQLSFSNRPHQITWGEFKAWFALWREDHERASVADFVKKQAANRESAPTDVAIELVGTCISHYAGILEGASNVDTAAEHVVLLAEGEMALKLLATITSDGVADVSASKIRTTDAFSRFMGVSMNWIHFNANPGEPELRRKEAELLRSWVRDCGKPSDLLALLKPWYPYNEGFQERAEKLRKTLRDELVEPLWQPVIEEALALFQDSSRFDSIHPAGTQPALEYVIISPQSKIYEAPHYPELLRVIGTASLNANVRASCLRYLQLLFMALEHRGGFCTSTERIQFFTSHPDVCCAIWAALVAAPFQYRMLSTLAKYRQSLIDCGLDSNLFPVPDWLSVNTSSTVSSSADNTG